MPRILKQFLYGAFFLLIFGGIIWGAYLWFVKPAPSCSDGIQNQGEQGIDCGGPCANVCIPSDIKPIGATGQLQIFHSTPTGISILVQVQNPNSAYAADRFSYTFKIYDNQNVLLSEITDESFVYGSEIKYLGAFNLPFPNANRIELFIGTPEWVPADSFKKPALVVQNVQTASTASGLQANGRFVNNDSVALGKVTALSIFYDASGKPAGISKNEVTDVLPGETRTFSVMHPLFLNPDLSRTAVFLYGKRPVLPGGTR